MSEATERRIPLLDHGYIELIDAWGTEERIIEAARMSTGKGFQGWGELRCACGATSKSARFTTTETTKPRTPFKDDAGTYCSAERGGAHVAVDGSAAGDEKLLRFLWTNKHQTPFEMVGLTVEVQAPILVLREWHRHRVPFGYNEMSARYTPLPDMNYIPSVERLMINASTTNKQAGTVAGSEQLTVEAAEAFREELETIYAEQEKLYQWALRSGVPKELARVHLPVGRYSRMRATGNLRGWLGFLALRMAPGAQFEIRQYANALGDIVAEKFPHTWALFMEGFRG
ncbi:MAG TPA: FAD-dependent thymidylate synthase [Polyangia bacterium]|nr:FAD-dependent thymidylate synthase [Polyangia bacterium]